MVWSGQRLSTEYLGRPCLTGVGQFIGRFGTDVINLDFLPLFDLPSSRSFGVGIEASSPLSEPCSLKQVSNVAWSNASGHTHEFSGLGLENRRTVRPGAESMTATACRDHTIRLHVLKYKTVMIPARSILVRSSFALPRLRSACTTSKHMNLGCTPRRLILSQRPTPRIFEFLSPLVDSRHQKSSLKTTSLRRNLQQSSPLPKISRKLETSYRAGFSSSAPVMSSLPSPVPIALCGKSQIMATNFSGSIEEEGYKGSSCCYLV